MAITATVVYKDSNGTEISRSEGLKVEFTNDFKRFTTFGHPASVRTGPLLNIQDKLNNNTSELTTSVVYSSDYKRWTVASAAATDIGPNIYVKYGYTPGTFYVPGYASGSGSRAPVQMSRLTITQFRNLGNDGFLNTILVDPSVAGAVTHKVEYQLTKYQGYYYIIVSRPKYSTSDSGWSYVYLYKLGKNITSGFCPARFNYYGGLFDNYSERTQVNIPSGYYVASQHFFSIYGNTQVIVLRRGTTTSYALWNPFTSTFYGTFNLTDNSAMTSAQASLLASGQLVSLLGGGGGYRILIFPGSGQGTASAYNYPAITGTGGDSLGLIDYSSSALLHARPSYFLSASHLTATNAGRGPWIGQGCWQGIDDGFFAICGFYAPYATWYQDDINASGTASYTYPAIRYMFGMYPTSNNISYVPITFGYFRSSSFIPKAFYIVDTVTKPENAVTMSIVIDWEY